MNTLSGGRNDFSLSATYTYYTYEIGGSESLDDTEDDLKESGDNNDFGHNIGEYYTRLSYGRGMI